MNEMNESPTLDMAGVAAAHNVESF